MFFTVLKRSAYGVAGTVFLVVGLSVAAVAVTLVPRIGDEPREFDRRTEAVVAGIVRTNTGGPNGGHTHVRVSYEADGRQTTARLRGGNGQGLRTGDRVEVFYRSGEPTRVATKAYAGKGPPGTGPMIAVMAGVLVMSTAALIVCWHFFTAATGRRRSLLSA
ncbi:MULTISPECIES: DUF3592 domain-containing protein [Streptomyces]|uniref:DUF3592 domain-containing protein n=1 Tax=Streptomyces TaxID=1883 RepID=UPI002249427F|nr:DUF3592 domain-containing protein [Streptomyces sp. JHD 1]MCX2971149.1 DUF3592 domain-containing protein [Streptomyces sp. JHD 1]